jgi:hypothetical protein
MKRPEEQGSRVTLA